MLPWLTYCILIFFAPLRGGLYMSFILSLIFCTFFYKNYTANHRSFQLFSVVYVLYIINTFIAHFTLIGYRSLPCLSAPFFSRFMSLYYQYCYCTFLSRYSTFFNACLYLFINRHLRANQSVYICYKYLLKWLNKAILSTF